MYKLKPSNNSAIDQTVKNPEDRKKDSKRLRHHAFQNDRKLEFRNIENQMAVYTLFASFPAPLL